MDEISTNRAGYSDHETDANKIREALTIHDQTLDGGSAIKCTFIWWFSAATTAAVRFAELCGEMAQLSACTSSSPPASPPSLPDDEWLFPGFSRTTSNKCVYYSEHRTLVKYVLLAGIPASLPVVNVGILGNRQSRERQREAMAEPCAKVERQSGSGLTKIDTPRRHDDERARDDWGETTRDFHIVIPQTVDDSTAEAEAPLDGWLDR